MSSNSTDFLMPAYIHILEAEITRLRLQKASLGVKTKTHYGEKCVVIHNYQRSSRYIIPVGSLHVRFMYGNHDNIPLSKYYRDSATGVGIDLVAHEAPPDDRKWTLEVVEFRLCQSAERDTYTKIITYDGDRYGVVYISDHPLGGYKHDPDDDSGDILYSDINAMPISDAYAHRILTEFIAGGASIHVKTLFYAYD